MTVHSSLVGRFQPLSKFVNGRSRDDERKAKRTAAEAQLEAAHRIVDLRDGPRCRICRRPCLPGAIKRAERAERHHVIPRSRGGQHVPENLIHVCLEDCHAAIHQSGTLRVSGDAEQRDERGRLNGIKVERLQRDTWRVVGWR